MKLLASLGGEQALLPHFLKYYTNLGVTGFYFAVQQGTRLPELPKNAHVTTTYPGGHNTIKDSIILSHLQHKYVAPDEWFLLLDADEFIVPPFPIAEIIDEAEKRECKWVLGRLVDRIAADGSLPIVDDNSDLETLFPCRCSLTKLLLDDTITKSVLVKGHLKIAPGHHGCDERYLDVALEIDHYKWHHGVLERLKNRVEFYRELGYEWWVHSKIFLDHYERYGKIDLTQLYPL